MCKLKICMYSTGVLDFLSSVRIIVFCIILDFLIIIIIIIIIITTTIIIIIIIIIMTLFKCQVYLALHVLIGDTVNRRTNISNRT